MSPTLAALPSSPSSSQSMSLMELRRASTLASCGMALWGIPAYFRQ